MLNQANNFELTFDPASIQPLWDHLAQSFAKELSPAKVAATPDGARRAAALKALIAAHPNNATPQPK